MNYYNEFDPFAAAWIRNLIAAGLIPAGDVDTRSITEVSPDDLKGYTQCHWFAGIGGWSRALELAGWPADEPVWTGSCPCQPFSTAGKRKGKDDERHLWPVWFELIRQSRPPVVFGEQVSSAIRHHWWDDVADDLEREGYTTRAEIRSACSVGAPHKRDRLWFVAEAMGQPDSTGPQPRQQTAAPLGQRCATFAAGGDVADTQREQAYQEQQRPSEDERGRRSDVPSGCGLDIWNGGVWIDCPDEKQRLVEPGICLLADGVRNRVGRLRGYGNAIVPQVAAEFIGAYMDCVRKLELEIL